MEPKPSGGSNGSGRNKSTNVGLDNEDINKKMPRFSVTTKK
jgi:hypothetical protein